MDFVHDQLSTGRKIRNLIVLDTFSRYVPALDRVWRQIGYPKTIRVDNVLCVE